MSILITSIKNVAGHDKRPPNETTPAKIKQHRPRYTTQDDKHTNDKKNPTDKKNILSIFLRFFFSSAHPQPGYNATAEEMVSEDEVNDEAQMSPKGMVT